MATNDSDSLRTAVQALAAPPELLKPYTVNGTKLRLPKDIGDKLHEVHELQRILGEVHYEGVPYEYQNEPTFSSAGEASTELENSLAEIAAIADLMLAADRNWKFADNTIESIGMMLTRQAKTARDAYSRLCETPDSAS